MDAAHELALQALAKQLGAQVRPLFGFIGLNPIRTLDSLLARRAFSQLANNNITPYNLPTHLPTYSPSYLGTSLPPYLFRYLPTYLPIYVPTYLPRVKG